MAGTRIGVRTLIRRIITPLLGQPKAMLRIAGLIWLVQIPSFISGEQTVPTDALVALGVPAGPLATALAVFVLLSVYLGTAWAAVGWHRLNVMDERPQILLPQPRGGHVIDYFIRSIVLSIVAWLPMLMLAGLLVALISGGMFIGPGLLAMAPATVLSSWLTLRLCPWLVSGAVDYKLSLGESWHGTRVIAGPLLGLSFIGIAIFAALVWTIVLVESFVADEDGYFISITAMLAFGTFACALFFVIFAICVSAFNTVYAIARDQYTSPPLPNS